jgi:hypothetical protein
MSSSSAAIVAKPQSAKQNPDHEFIIGHFERIIPKELLEIYQGLDRKNLRQTYVSRSAGKIN